jgi:uncharacterized DUF497 family protein
MGVVDGVSLTVVFTDRFEGGQVVRRIISARVSNTRERKAFQDSITTP